MGSLTDLQTLQAEPIGAEMHNLVLFFFYSGKGDLAMEQLHLVL